MATCEEIEGAVRNLEQMLCTLGYSESCHMHGFSKEEARRNTRKIGVPGGGVARNESSYAKINYLIVLRRREIPI